MRGVGALLAGMLVSLITAGLGPLAAEPMLLPVRTFAPPGWRALPAKPLATASADSLQVIAQIYAIIDHAMTFGDTDHDGLNEVIMAVFDPQAPFSYRILEEQGNNTYHEEYVGPYMDPYAVGDLDKDGNSEIVGQKGYTLVVYESASPSTYPTVLIWTSPPLTNIIGYPTIGDTDRDGNMEIIHSVNTLGVSWLAIFENTGDNTFVQVYNTQVSAQDDGPKVVADLDQDGLIEIAFCGTYGYLHVFESPATDVWQETFTGTTGLDNAYAVSGGADTDGNGKPELFVAGDKYVLELGRFLRATHVYETASDNYFTRVATLIYDDQHMGGVTSAVADIDGAGRPEYVLCVFRQLLVYRAVAPGEWLMTVGAIDPDVDGTHVYVHTFDVNLNGRSEIFWSAEGSIHNRTTLVLEHPPVPVTDVQPSGALALEALTVVPNPCQAQATLLLGPRSRATASAVAVFDAAGRLVSRARPVRGAYGQVLWANPSLRPGLYFLRVEGLSGRPLAVGRTVVVR